VLSNDPCLSMTIINHKQSKLVLLHVARALEILRYRAFGEASGFGNLDGATGLQRSIQHL